MDDKTQQLLEEWKDIRETLRNFGNKRFAQLTVFIGVSGFMFDAFFKQGETPYRIALGLSGVVGSMLFLVMEYSSVLYWSKFAERGKTIEAETGATLKLMTSYRPPERLFSATKAIYFLYVAVALLWGFTLLGVKQKTPVGAVQIVQTTLQAATGLAGKAKSEWALKSLLLDGSGQSWQVVIMDTGSSATLNVSLDAVTGKIVKMERVN